MSLKKFNDLSPLAQHLLQLVLAAFVVGVAWATMAQQLEDVKQDANANTKNVQGIQEQVHEVQRAQAVIQTKLDAAAERNKEFRNDARAALERILDKLDRNIP